MPVIIYTKGESPIIIPSASTNEVTIFQITRDDNGREASTWLKHIVKNYFTLADFTLFVQGRYTDHCENLMKVARFDQNFTWLCGEMCITNKDGSGQGVPDISDVFEKLFKHTPLNQYEFGKGGMFMASKILIHKHPQEYYQGVLDFFNQRGGIWAWYMERFWKYLFEGIQ
jgi:hypothetical protein